MKPNQPGTAKLAAEFTRRLESYIGAENFAKVKALNAAEMCANVCHSGDFCDSNEVMREAFIEALGWEPDTQDEDDLFLWNVAWAIFRHPEPVAVATVASAEGGL